MEGKVLGSYEILERLGAGGQGHVYRARDTTLDREIAVKVLPPAFIADPSRLKQFQQEAKMLAAASHPNIAAVYAIEEFEEIRFFTQELVPGMTLADKIKSGPLDLLDTLEIARQVAAALETAHEKRLIHRDLKPANVMVQPDGRVKVLDFGLALPVDREDGDEEYGLSDSAATISRTADSIIVGTAPYMSPDQARGKLVDRRTDVWSFGCILFECLSGERPFEGDTLLDTLSAIVRSEPNWDVLPATVPRRLRHLIQRCLRKRVSDRIQHVGDARIVLEELIADPTAGQDIFGEPGGESAAPAAIPPSGSARNFAAAALIGGLALGAAAMWALQPAAPAQKTLRMSKSLEPARLDFENSSAIAISPDGERIAYSARHEGELTLFVSALGAFDAVPIDGTAGAMNPFFSPDGSWVGFFSEDFQLAKVPVDGGVVVPICDVPVGNIGATWLEDDSIVFATFSTGAGLQRVAASGGEPSFVTELNLEAGETNHGWPHAVAGRNAVLFAVSRVDGNHISVLDLATGEHRLVMEGGDQARYTNSGHLLVSQQGALLAMPFDVAAFKVTGTPAVVVEDMFGTDRNATGFDASPNGTLVYAPGAKQDLDRFVWVDRGGAVEPLPLEPGSYGHPRIAPNGTQLVFDSPHDGGQDIWVYDTTRNIATRLTTAGDNVLPVWSPDGRQILFASSGRGQTGLYWHRSDGSGESHLMAEAEGSLWPLSWQEQQIAYYALNADTGRDIWIYEAGSDGDGGGGAAARPFQATSFNERSPMISPDGRWVAYVSNDSGRDEVYVKGLGGEETKYTISNGGGVEPVWGPDGSELFYRSGRSLMVVPVIAGRTLQIGSPLSLFEGDFKQEPVAGNQYYDISPDGQRFLMILEDETQRGPDKLHVIVGLGAELTDPSS